MGRSRVLEWYLNLASWRREQHNLHLKHPAGWAVHIRTPVHQTVLEVQTSKLLNKYEYQYENWCLSEYSLLSFCSMHRGHTYNDDWFWYETLPTNLRFHYHRNCDFQLVFVEMSGESWEIHTDFLAWKPEWIIPPEGPSCRLKNNIKMALLRRGAVDWINVTQDRNYCLDFVVMVMNVWVEFFWAAEWLLAAQDGLWSSRLVSQAESCVSRSYVFLQYWFPQRSF
jgi:hypothetical protein